MGIRVGDFKVVYESVTMTPIEPEYLCADKKKVKEYMRRHPMPDDPAYSKEDLILDLTESSGFYTLPKDIKDETAEYVAGIVSYLLGATT